MGTGDTTEWICCQSGSLLALQGIQCVFCFAIACFRDTSNRNSVSLLFHEHKDTRNTNLVIAIVVVF
jgi:hypothetical protein